MQRILVAEDSPTQAEQLKFILEDGGFEVDVAGNAETALQYFSRKPFDMVISDIVMPGLSGYDLCDRIKRGAGGQDVPVVLLSTLSDPMDIVRGLECGADNFITKPYAPEQLIGRVRGVLENRTVRSKGKLSIDVETMFLGKKLVVSSEKEQMLDLLIAMAGAKAELESHARELERRVQERTAELASQQEELARAQAVAHLGNWRLAIATGRIEWSEEMFRIFGVTAKGFAHTLDAMLDMVHPADRVALAQLLRRSIAQNDTCRHEFRIVRPNGEERQCWIESRCQADQRNEVEAVFGVCQDVTERKLMQLQLHQAQKIDAVGQLTGGIAHDFNNILTIIIGTGEILAAAVADRPQLAALAKMIDEAAERGAELTRHLLAFARKQPLQPQETDINALTIRTTKLLRPTLGEHIEIESMLKEEAWPALVDPNQLTSALVNLALNARDAMPNGGKLIVETGNVHLDETYASAHSEVEPGPYVMIAVSDTGSGIAPEVRDKVFEPFFTTKGTGKGTGLGLSMVYGFVKQSRGHIKLYSEVGHGTTIKVYLPKASGDELPTADAPITTAEGGHETIVVVEDDISVRDYVVAQLHSLGYRTVTASNASEALALLEGDAELHLLFTDMVMPGTMNGRQLAEEALKRRSSLKVLFTSGYAESALVHNGRLDPGVLLLPKPYRKSDLARMVRKALSTCREAQQVG